MSDKKAEVGASEDWYLYLPPTNEPLQPYRRAPTAWPISAEELKRTEAQAAATHASALNDLGTKMYA
jgi:hypothetical protein